jgi:hypothetical protein
MVDGTLDHLDVRFGAGACTLELRRVICVRVPFGGENITL